jgi:hypothetical protein
MGFAWHSNADGTAEAVEYDPFAEVVYENDQVLVVNVARGVLPDVELENALVDALALSEHRPDAEHAIAAAADALGFDMHPRDDSTQRALTIAPSEESVPLR